jgi:hypothetical protein
MARKKTVTEEVAEKRFARRCLHDSWRHEALKEHPDFGSNLSKARQAKRTAESIRNSLALP